MLLFGLACALRDLEVGFWAFAGDTKCNRHHVGVINIATHNSIEN